MMARQYTEENLIKHTKKLNYLIKRRFFNAAIKYLNEHKGMCKYYMIPKSKAKKQFNISEKEINKLQFVEMLNPVYRSKSPMKLYLTAELNYKFGRLGKIEKILNKNKKSV